MDNNSTKSDKFHSFIAKHKKSVIITSAIVVLAGGISFAYTMNVKSEVNSWKDKIYPGVQAYGVDLSGKTKEEAVETLNNELVSMIGNKTIVVTVGDKNFELKYSDINPSISAEVTVEAALEYGKTDSMFKQKSMIKKGTGYNVETGLTYDDAKLKEFENTVAADVDIEAKDASISITSGQINITPEVNGKKIDIEELDKKLVESINPDPTSVENISVELMDYSPRITAEDLSKIDGKISGYVDSYNNDGSGRVTNMEIATSYINGTLLMPGDEFSYNQTIGETTADRGYKEANTYVGGSVVPGYGGGVCQISTALYRSAMRANLKSTIRYNHSMMVGYSAASLDATVAEGDIDYRFINTYDYPIYIEGYTGGGSIVFNIYGNTEAMEGKSYELVNEVTEKLDFTTEYINDPTLAEGQEAVKTYGAPGYRSKGYLVTYENGVEVSRELISTDTYQPMNTIIRRGTKKVETPTVNTEEKPAENSSSNSNAGNTENAGDTNNSPQEKPTENGNQAVS